MDKDMPADWAIERACELVNAAGGGTLSVKIAKGAIGLGHNLALNALARYIEAHEQPPVDPDLETAREICAMVADQWDSGDGAEGRYREGCFDNDADIQFVVAKLKEARGK